MEKNETTPEVKEEKFCKKLTKQAIMSFTISAATTAGLFATMMVLSALAKPKMQRDLAITNANETETTE
jgi:hypothetical protein